MQLNQLSKIKTKEKKRVGRGYGSGKGGHTTGRGNKGQKVREKVSLTFAGTKTKKSLLRRLPLQRGKGKLKPKEKKPIVVNLKYLNLFKEGETVDIKSLVKKGIIKKNEAEKYPVKILGDGELKVALKVALPCSKKAAEKIKKAKGEIILGKNE
ncbi:MAG: 50S ribosomal protein L15 [Microgenomates group bacterium]